MIATEHTFVLPNGLRVLLLPDKGEVAFCGLLTATGTRDELPNEHGYAHLTEHMFFKGTKKRSAAQIINRLEAVGGELNAYTTKEETVVYAVSLKRDLARAVELVADVCLNVQFLPDNLDKEKEVVMDEIDSYLDSPAESIIDDFEDAVFSGYAIGRNILGTKTSLQEVTVPRLQAFYDRTYTPDNQLFFIMGDVSVAQVEKWVYRYLVHPKGVRSYTRQQPALYHPCSLEVQKNTSQAHCLLGGRAIDAHSSLRYVSALLNNILGGTSANSRLNMSLRERHALVYQVESQVVSYTDTGVWSIYLGTDHADLKRALRLVRAELDKLCQHPLSDRQLLAAKRQLLAQQIISSDNKESWVLNAAKNYFLKGSIATYAEIEEKINAITAPQLMALAQQYFAPENQSQLVFQ